MKISKIILKDYGPIKEFSLKPGNFNVIFGLNETGKTTLVEALTSVLFKTRARYGRPENINIELDTGEKLISLPHAKQISILPRIEITSLLYIPASESELYDRRDEPMKFWDSLKLILSRTEKQIPFTTLIKKLREEIGYYPKSSGWKVDKQRLIDNEKDRLEKLREFIKKIGEVEIEKKELKRLTAEYSSLKKELELIENTKKYKFYQHLKRLCDEYFDKKYSLELYQRYAEDDLIKWQELEVKKENLKRHLEEKTQIEAEINSLNKEISEILKKLDWLEKHDIRQRISLRSEIGNEPNFFYPILIFLTGFLFLILSFRFNFSIIIPLVIFLISIMSFTIVAIKKASIRIKKLRLDEILNIARLYLPEVQTIEELEKSIKMLEDNKIRIETLLDTKKDRLNLLSTLGSSESIEREMEELRNKTGCGTIVQLKAKIEAKNKIQDEIRAIGVEIAQYLNESDDKKWKRLIDEREISPPLKECDTSRAEKLEGRMKILKEQIDKLMEEIKIFEEVQKRRYDIVNEIDAPGEIFKLENRLKEYELELRAVQKAEEILNQMSNELDNFIEKLIYGEDSLSEYFHFVTQKYKEVKIENRDFIAVDNMGNRYSIEKLSSGTKDQLLLCFRFSALKKICPGGIFLILDDAFIFADWDRRRRLIELLKKFIDEGNQVFYFTSDEHTKDLLVEYGAMVTNL